MVGIRDIRRKARRDLHNALRVPAYYRANTVSPWTRVHVRDFTKPSVNVAFGRHANSLGLSEIQDVDPKILVMRDEFASLGITLARGGQFSIEVGEAWQVDNLEAPYDISVTAIVKPVKDNAGFPIPEPD